MMRVQMRNSIANQGIPDKWYLCTTSHILHYEFTRYCLLSAAPLSPLSAAVDISGYPLPLTDPTKERDTLTPLSQEYLAMLDPSQYMAIWELQGLNEFPASLAGEFKRTLPFTDLWIRYLSKCVFCLFTKTFRITRELSFLSLLSLHKVTRHELE